ncbi:MAG: polysaccharide deacetylase family protein [Candidatus Spechtbacterales bacterium]
MKNIAIFIVFILVGTVLFLGFRNNKDVAEQEIPQIESGITVLPERLNLEIPDGIPEPNNPCYSLEVSESAKLAKNEFADKTEQAKTNNDKLLSQIELPLEIYQGRIDDKRVALTIDTGVGGKEGMNEILKIAEHYNIHLTFFVTGCWILENPELTQRIFKDGHTIGSHGLTHANLSVISDEKARMEISETDRIFNDVLGYTPVFFRKPQYAGGERVVNILAEFDKISAQGYPNLGDTTGWRSGTAPEDVLNLVKRDTEPGAIWVFHNLSATDLKAFEDMVRFHLEEGYKLVKIEEILF